MREERPDAPNDLSEAWLRLLLDQLPAHVWMTDTDLRLTSFQGAGFAGQGEEVRRRLGLTLHEFFETDDPHYEPIAAHRRALGGDSAGYEIALYGREFQVWVEPLRDERGAIVGCLGLGQDVTEQKRLEAELRASEARWRAVFDALPVGVALADRERRVLACNPAYERLTGFDAPDLCGRRFPVATHLDDAAADMALWRELVAGGRDRYWLEKRYMRPDGETVWGRLTALRLPDEADTPEQFIGFIEDLTELRALREYLRDLLPKLDALGSDADTGRALLGLNLPDRRGAHPAASAQRRAAHGDAPDKLPALTSPLTPRDRQLLHLLARDKHNREIADTLRRSEKTVRNYLSMLYEKIGVDSRSAAATWARRHGIGDDTRR